MFAALYAKAACFDTHERDLLVGNKGMEKANGVAAPSDTGDQAVGKTAFRGDSQ